MNAGSTAQQIDLPFQDPRRQPTRLGCQKESDRRGPRRRFHQWSRMEEWKRWNGRLAKVATDTNILDLRTRYRTKLGWFFWFVPIQRYNTTVGKWQILYLWTRYRYKLGWFFWFGPIQVTIRCKICDKEYMFHYRKPCLKLLREAADSAEANALVCASHDGHPIRHIIY